jgi:hypothetical protein
MAWVAPEDEQLYGSWSEDGEPTLPPPSKDATPQLTTKSGRSAIDSSSELVERGSNASTAKSKEVPSVGSKFAGSNGSTNYPDTGYPPLQQPNSARSGEPTSRSLTGSPGAPAERTPRQAAPALRAQPQRGFYGDSYDESRGRYAETTAGAEDLPPPGRYSEEGANSGRYADPDPSDSRYAAPAAGARPGAEEALVSDPDQGYDPRGGQPGRDLPEDAGRAPYADDLAAPSDGPQGMSGATRQIADGIRQDYEKTSEELRGRLKGTADSLSNSTREMTNNVQGIVRQAGEQVERGTAEMGRSLREGYSRYSDPGAEPLDDRDSGDLANDLPPAAESGYGDSTTVDAQVPQATRANRSSQPWRPGSTGTYPAGDLDQTQLPAGRGEIEPASYPANVGNETRLTPAYR